MFICISAFTLILLASINDHQKISKQAIFSIFGLGNVGAFFYSGDYFNPNPNPYIHLWSLGAEEQLYLLLPIMALLFLRSQKFSSYETQYPFLKLTGFSFSFFIFAVLLDSKFHVFALISDYYLPFSKIWLFALGGFLRHSSISFSHLNHKARRFSIVFLFWY